MTGSGGSKMQLVFTKIATFFSGYFGHKTVSSVIKQKISQCKQAMKQVKQRIGVLVTPPVPFFSECD